MNPLIKHPTFYNNPTIQKLAPLKRWTVSDNEKVPLNINTYIQKKRVYGAVYPDERCLNDLSTVISTIPQAANNTLYHDTLENGYIILDIEPSCPIEIRNELITIPCLYIETSMSGKGYHLIMEKPKNFNDFEIAKRKKVFKESNRYYEILLSHYITFTRNTIDVVSDPNKSIDSLFATLAKEQIEIEKENIIVNPEKPKDIPYEDEILGLLMGKTYRRTLKDFSNEQNQPDHSRYEYGCCSYYKYLLNTLLKNAHYKNVTITNEQKTWLIYTIVEAKIAPRKKHSEHREGLPWLLYMAREVVARIE